MSSDANVIPRRARPGVAGLRLHSEGLAREDSHPAEPAPESYISPSVRAGGGGTSLMRSHFPEYFHQSQTYFRHPPLK